MGEIGLWLTEGMLHIADFAGFDHMLFLLVLCTPYFIKGRYLQLFWLISGFTIGHSVALALSVLGIITLPSAWVEIGIAITILVTALMAILQKPEEAKQAFVPTLFLVIFFGLIHGLGFSTLLKSMLSEQEGVLKPLLFFNLGLEVGQLLIVLVLFVITWLLEKWMQVKLQRQIKVYGLLAALVALVLTWQRLQDILN
jgi:uncharacterized membrane protein YozB (DUF420 family)